MPAVVVLGAQWGDEGKGKATDLLTTEQDIDFCVRTSGGHNAGHTIVVNGERFATHLLPSSILTPSTVSVIGNGVVVSPEALFREYDALLERGVTPVLLGSPKEKALADAVKAASKRPGDYRDFVGNSIDESLALLAACRVALGGDTGLLHAARALGVPAVALFGPTDPGAHHWEPASAVAETSRTAEAERRNGVCVITTAPLTNSKR